MDSEPTKERCKKIHQRHIATQPQPNMTDQTLQNWWQKRRPKTPQNILNKHEHKEQGSLNYNHGLYLGSHNHIFEIDPCQK